MDTTKPPPGVARADLDPARGGGLDRTDPESIRGGRTRALAGKALLIFLTVMIALTWGNQMLREMTIATVSPISVQRGALEKRVEGSGVLRASRILPIIAPETARVTRVYVEAGASVEKGDPLFALDLSDVIGKLDDECAAAREELASRQRAMDWAAADLPATTLARLGERIQSVQALQDAWQIAEEACARPGIQDESSAPSARRAADSARAAYESEKRRLDSDATVRDYITKAGELEKARDKLAQAEQSHADALVLCADDGAYTYIARAPVQSGVISVSVEAGSMCQVSVPAVQLSDLSGGLTLRVEVDRDAAESLAPGDVAAVTVSDRVYDCPIVSLTESLEKKDVYELAFLLPGSAGTAGMTAAMSLRKRTANYDAIIPSSALYADSQSDFVYVIEQAETSLGARMSVRRVNVVVTDEDNTRVALQAGVSQRDSIVARSDRPIADGDRVRLEE